jgi:hypothetical protein
MLSFIYQNARGLVHDQLIPSHVTLDSPDTVDAMQCVMDLEESYSISPPFDEFQCHPGSAFEMVLEGRVAMYVSSMSFRDYVSPKAVWPFQWGVAPLREGRYRATVASIEGVAILKNAPNPGSAGSSCATWSPICFQVLVPYPSCEPWAPPPSRRSF